MGGAASLLRGRGGSLLIDGVVWIVRVVESDGSLGMSFYLIGLMLFHFLKEL
jgi:hypothetical protein